MNYTVKVVVLALVVMAGIALFTMRGDCEDDHDVQSVADCAGVCCCELGLSCVDPAGGVSVRGTESFRSFGILCTGRLIIADIFRPPTSA